MRFFDVPPNHPLSQYHTFAKLRFHGVEGHSIEQLMWHVKAKQQGDEQLATEILEKRKFKWTPGNIRSEVENLVGDFKVGLVMKEYRLYNDIVMFQLTQRDSLFLHSLKTTIGNTSRDTVVEFLVFSSTNERVYSIHSYRKKNHGAEMDDFTDGFNVYGLILSRAAYCYLREVRPKFFHPAQGMGLLQECFYEDDGEYRVTVLLLSDSNAGMVSSIRGGLVVPVSGGTYGDMVAVIDQVREELGLKLRHCKYIIVNCGINVVQKSTLREDPSYLLPLRDRLVKTAAQRDQVSVLFSTEFFHPQLRCERECARAHAESVERAFEGSKVAVVNWFKQHSPFYAPDESLNMRYFEDRDGFHLSHHGFRAMWSIWCDHLEYLRYVPFTMKKNSATLPPPTKRRRAEY